MGSNGPAAVHPAGIEEAGSPYLDSKATRVVDLRSDTVTKPTPKMLSAMAAAEVDDDVLGVDPTVERLQQQMAKVLGKEAGLFVPSGTMGNLISVLVHCEVRGSEVILGSECHIHVYEQGGIATLGGVYPHLIPNNPDGTMDLGKVEAAIRPDDEHFPTSRLICIENTHNRCGGRCISAEYTDKISELAKWYGLKLHVDGARIFNASSALGVPAERLVRAADSVSARKLRKALGGGMRQVGVLAAAGLVALEDMAGRLEHDHRNARILAEGLAAIAGLKVDLASVQTNIVYAEVTSASGLGAEELCEALKEHGILALTFGPTAIRVVTHYQISEDDVRLAISRFQDTLLRTAVKAQVTQIQV